MNRRVLVRNLSLAVAGGAVAAGLDWDQFDEAESYSVITGDHEFVLRKLRRWGCDEERGFNVSTTSIVPAPQDLAVVRSGRLVDPLDLRGGEKELLEYLRTRRMPGDRLVTAERRTPQPAGVVDFRVDGRLIDRVRLDKAYRNIEIKGVHGATIFAIDDNQVRVRSSSCRRQLCRTCGDVRSGRIVCAPNRLVATVSGAKMEHDAVSG